MAKTAQKVVELANSWLGKNEKDGSYKEIVDIYNSQSKFPRNVKMQYGWSWCACTWSALAIKLGYTDIMPVEISCGELVNLAKNMGIWIEYDGTEPHPGDAVLYDWQDNGSKDCIGWPDHIGLVDYVNQESGYFTTIEGNYNDSVKKRTVSINGRYIRGFIRPKYDEIEVPNNVIIANKSVDKVAHEVIAGQWGNKPDRKVRLESNGYNYDEVQSRVNEILTGSAVQIPAKPNTAVNQPYNKKIVTTCRPAIFEPGCVGNYVTTADLYLRNDAGTNKKALAVIPKGTTVLCKGFYSTSGSGLKWLLVNFIMNGVYYEGFSSINHLKKVYV